MSRARRLVLGLALAGAAAGGGYLAWVSAAGTPAALDLLPAGAEAVVELRGAQPLARRLSGTRFAAAFARSGTRAWLEQSDAVAALDAARAGIGRLTGFTPGRGIAFDVLGAEAAIGWYPADRGSPGPLPWAAAGRLSVRAWAVSGALRLARAAGIGAPLVGSERVHGTTLYTVPAGDGRRLHLLFAGRGLVASSDVELARLAARAAADAAGSLGRSPQLQALRGALPARGELFAWIRDPGRLAGSALAHVAGGAPLGLVLRAGDTIEIDVAAPAAADDDPGALAAPLPGIALLDSDPLLFLSSRDPVPPGLRALLVERQRSVAALRPNAAAGAPDAVPARGYAIVVAGTGPGSGLFPAPRGLVMIGMADAGAAAEALRRSFPPGAPVAPAGTARALTSRESFPLAGEFELAGAALGRHLLFATDASLIAGASAEAPPAAAPVASDPSWRVHSIASVSMVKTLPLVRRWAAPISGLVGARWPGAPEIGGDLDLLAAIRTVRVVAGSDGRFRRASATLGVGDLP